MGGITKQCRQGSHFEDYKDMKKFSKNNKKLNKLNKEAAPYI